MSEERVSLVSVLDEQKGAVSKEAADLRASLRDVERARLEARRELQELRRQVCVRVCVYVCVSGKG